MPIGNVLEMSCVLTTGNVPEILDLPYTASGKVKEMSKFPGAGNVHAMNKKCELSSTFRGISGPCPGNLGFLPVKTFALFMDF